MPDPANPGMVVYTIRAAFDTEATRQAYLSWLLEGHSQAVVREGGARSGEVSLLDDGTVESRYLFDTRERFAAYEAGPAVALRAEGARRFPPEAGEPRLTRTLGVRMLRVPD